MSEKQGLHTLLNPATSTGAPLFIIYSQYRSERLDYVCDFIFNRVLGAGFELTDSHDVFEKSPLLKINYSGKKIPGIVQIIPHMLLFETGVDPLKPQPVMEQGMIWFFKTEGVLQEPALHFDLLAAVFYFISRYEEWQEFEKDAHGRFEAKASLLFPTNFHLKPVVDHWILELKQLIQRAYPQAQLPARDFQVLSTIDVDNLYAYRAKGLVRTFGGFMKDLLKLNFTSFRERYRVITGRAKDPFDVYEDVSEFCTAQHIPLLWFFLFRTGTRYDRTVSPASGAFKHVMAQLKAKNVQVGLHPSYDAAFRPSLMEEEVKKFSTLLEAPVRVSRQHFLRFEIRSTPKLLLKQGITTDFTMGFASSPGFRAGTSHPFFYYDLLSEKKTELLFVPFCAMDGAYLVYDKQSPDAAYDSLMALAQEVKKTNGIFTTVFHERTFFNHLYPGFGPLYKKLHLALKGL